MNTGDIEFDENVHFFCVSWSDDPKGKRGYEERHFYTHADAAKFAEYPVSEGKYTWISERGNCRGKEDVSMVYWWSDNLRDMPEYKFHPPCRGSGHFSDDTPDLSSSEETFFYQYEALSPE